MGKSTFSDGSFVLHKIPNVIQDHSGAVGSGWHKVSAWYTADGTLVDCEYYDKANTARTIPKRWVAARSQLERLGRIYADRADY